MRVLLIRYHQKAIINSAMLEHVVNVEGVTPPLGLAYVAAAAEQAGHEVRILDCQALGLTAEQVREEIKAFAPQVVGINCMTPILPGVLEAAKITKDVDKEIKVVIGGPHVGIFPEETVSFSFIDFAVHGEGEITFVEFLDALEHKKPMETVKGLVWKRDGKAVQNELREPIRDLDSLPLPARHLLPMDKYNVIIMKYPMATMIASRGCPFHCSYCFKDHATRVYRTRSAKSVVDEMQMLVEKYHVREIGFYDDCWPNKQLLIDVCNEIIKRGLMVSWESPQRVDLVDPELLKLAKRAGCLRFRFGVESGSPRLLSMIKKGNLKQIRNAFKWSQEAGLETFAFFMVGYPTETKEDFQMTIEVAKEIKADWALFGATMPMPGTRLWEHAINEYGYDKNYWHDWALGKTNEPVRLFFEDSKERVSIAYREFYLRPLFVWQKLTTIRGLYDLQRYWKGFQTVRQMR